MTSESQPLHIMKVLVCGAVPVISKVQAGKVGEMESDRVRKEVQLHVDMVITVKIELEGVVRPAEVCFLPLARRG